MGNETERFDGFPAALPAFLADLTKNNDKTWFERRRDDYDRVFLGPARAAVGALTAALNRAGLAVDGEPKVGGSIKRLHRDIRFSKDKRPFDPRLHLVFWQGSKAKFAPSLHCVIGPDYCATGAGIWQFSPAQLDAFRHAVADGNKGDGLAAAIAATEASGFGALREPDLKRVPAGFDSDAPHAGLLRHKGLAVGRRGDLSPDLFTTAAVDHLVERLGALSPLHDWLVANLPDG